MRHRRKNGGRSRFLILEEMKSVRGGSPTIRKYAGPMKAPFRCPANAHRLFDLISVDDAKFLPAFYFALSDTLVTTSLEIVGARSGCEA